MRFLRFAAPFTLVAFAIALPAAAGRSTATVLFCTVTAVSMYDNGSIRAPTETRRSAIRSDCRTRPGSTAGQLLGDPARPNRRYVCAREPDGRLRHAAARVRGILGCLHRSFTLPF